MPKFHSRVKAGCICDFCTSVRTAVDDAVAAFRRMCEPLTDVPRFGNVPTFGNRDDLTRMSPFYAAAMAGESFDVPVVKTMDFNDAEPLRCTDDSTMMLSQLALPLLSACFESEAEPKMPRSPFYEMATTTCFSDAPLIQQMVQPPVEPLRRMNAMWTYSPPADPYKRRD